MLRKMSHSKQANHGLVAMNSLSKEDLQNKIATLEKYYTTSTLGI